MNLKQVLTLSALSLAICNAYGLTLGPVQKEPTLGQPLHVVIPVRGRSQDFQATLATPSQYRARGMVYANSLYGIQVSTEEVGGHLEIVVHGDQPFNDPFLQLLLNVRWEGDSRGQDNSFALQRAYTLLFNPPAPVPDVQALAAALPGASHQGSSPASAPVVSKAKSPSARASIRASLPAALGRADLRRHPRGKTTLGGPPRSARLLRPISRRAGTIAAKNRSQSRERWHASLVVQPGQTLFSIASSIDPVRASEVAREIFRRNPKAFIRGNRNLIRAGARLVVPRPMALATLRANPRDLKRPVLGRAKALASTRESILRMTAASSKPQNALEQGMEQAQAQMLYYRTQMDLAQAKVHEYQIEEEARSFMRQTGVKVAGLSLPSNPAGGPSSVPPSTSLSTLPDPAIAHPARIASSATSSHPKHMVPAVRMGDAHDVHLAKSQDHGTSEDHRKPFAAAKKVGGPALSKPHPQAFVPSTWQHAGEAVGALLAVLAGLYVTLRRLRIPSGVESIMGAEGVIQEDGKVLEESGEEESMGTGEERPQPEEVPQVLSRSLDPTTLSEDTAPQSRPSPANPFLHSGFRESQFEISHDADPVVEADFYLHNNMKLQAMEVLKECVKEHPDHEKAWFKILEIIASEKDTRLFRDALKACPSDIMKRFQARIRRLKDTGAQDLLEVDTASFQPSIDFELALDPSVRSANP